MLRTLHRELVCLNLHEPYISTSPRYTIAHSSRTSWRSVLMLAWKSGGLYPLGRKALPYIKINPQPDVILSRN